MRKKQLLLGGLLGLIITVASACGQGTASPDDYKRQYGAAGYQDRGAADRDMETTIGRDDADLNNRYGDDTIAREVNPNMVTGRDTDLYNLGWEADRMADAAAGVAGVEDAVAVINGGYAYVAIDLEDTVSRDQAGKVEREVTRTLQRIMPRYDFRVTSNNRLLNRIRDIGDGLRNGTPNNNYRTDFNDLDRDLGRTR